MSICNGFMWFSLIAFMLEKQTSKYRILIIYLNMQLLKMFSQIHTIHTCNLNKYNIIENFIVVERKLKFNIKIIILKYIK